MLTVESIKNGIVIDHITAGKGMKIFQRLKLEEVPYGVVLLMNVPSGQLGHKDIIKIENIIDLDFTVLGLIDSNVTINIIKDSKLVEKKSVEIPEKISGLFTCSNPRCVTNYDNSVVPEFTLLSKNGVVKYKCEYCEESTGYRV